MDNVPLLSSNHGTLRRFSSKPSRSLQWLYRHPLASAAMWMLLGGGLVYFYLINSSSQQLAQPSTAATPATASSHAVQTQITAGATASVPGTYIPTEAPAEPPMCEDTCLKAKDGICDDGRYVTNMTRGLGSRVLCDLGTDCSDCGVWKGKKHSDNWKEPVGPIQYLRQANITVLVKRSALEPLVYFAYTDPAHDTDLSKHYDALGTVEPAMSHVAYHVLHGPCQNVEGGVMLDVGANFGWYSLMAAMLGCRVVAWEPVPIFRAFMEYSIARNKLHHKIELRPSAVVQYASPPGQRNYTVVAPHRGIWGTASIDGRNIDQAAGNQGLNGRFNVTGETLDQVLHSKELKSIALLKIDIEGHEPYAIAGARQLLQQQSVDNILLEYSPQVLQRHDISHIDLMPRMLLSVLAAGFKLGHIARKDFGDRHVTSLSEPLEMLPAVTATNLNFDLFDCMQMTETGHTWLRPPCSEMLHYKLISDGVPERLHPKSFRSSFEVNTNVWASRNPRFIPYLEGPPVGAFPAERKLTDSWFIPEWSDSAMGGRSCKNLQQFAADENMTAAQRASLLISHRCRCGSAKPCEQEEKIADSCAQAGKTPFSDDPEYVVDKRK